MWKSSELRLGKCYKQRIVDHAAGSLRKPETERSMFSDSLAHEVSEGNRDSLGNWAKGHL